jgi:hypothetical protein
MPPLADITNTTNSQTPKPKPSKFKDRKDVRPGPKQKKKDRLYVPPPPIKKIKRSYTRERKIAVIKFHKNHRIWGPNQYTGEYEWRRPYYNEMAEYFKIPASTIGRWWRTQDNIYASKCGSRQSLSVWVCHWPELEQRLYTDFQARRAALIPVRRSWFRRTSQRL